MKASSRVRLVLDNMAPWVTIYWDDIPVFRFVSINQHEAQCHAAVIRAKVYPAGHKKARWTTEESLVVTWNNDGRARITMSDNPVNGETYLRLVVTQSSELPRLFKR